MKTNSIETLSKIINLLDVHVLTLLQKKELDDEKVISISSIRIEYMDELTNLIRTRNTREMYDKKYYDLYRKTKSKS